MAEELKYELTSETMINVFGIKLFRIRATVSFGNVTKGDLGGWVESERTLSGNAWVYGNAQVYGGARVYGNAWVSGNAAVYGGAWDKPPLQIQGTRHFFNICAIGKIQIGCIDKTFEEWEQEFESIGKLQEYSDSEIKEYGLYIQLAIELYK